MLWSFESSWILYFTLLFLCNGINNVITANKMLSVVIITKNEAHIIEKTLQSLQDVSDDIIVVDSGSTDGTVEISKKWGARVLETGWQGYGANKNMGNEAAKNDWILSIDADEELTPLLKASIKQATPFVNGCVYRIKRRSLFCNKPIRYGVWARDNNIRLFNRNEVKWDLAEVHENLVFKQQLKVKALKGHMLHYTVTNLTDYSNKTLIYARLNAKKYFQMGKKAGFFKLYFGPFFTFIQFYFFRLGFLDGWEGYLICRTNAWYTFMKYVFLKELNEEK